MNVKMSKEMVEQLANDFFHLIPILRKNIIKPFEKISKPTLSPMQVQVLFFLKDKGILSMSELAVEMHVLKQQLTFLTDKLAENNFIERVHDKEDRRSVKISITQYGVDFLEEQKKQILNLLINIFEQLSIEDINELHTAIRSMYKIMDRL